MITPERAAVLAGLEIAEIPNWVLSETVERDGRLTKLPLRADTHQLASVSDPATWTTFSNAVARANGHGLGWVTTPATGIVLGDLDGVRTPTTGAIEPWASALVTHLDTYAEISQSGCGLHFAARATLPPGRRRAGRVEAYDAGRYFALTGDVLGTPKPIAQRDLTLFHKLLPLLGDEDFLRLTTGADAGFPSGSEADLSFVSRCARGGLTSEEIDQAFRIFRLGFRPKWLRDDYRLATLRTVTSTPAPAVTVTPATAQATDAASIVPEFSEDALALRFVGDYGDSIRFLNGAPFVWDGQVWRRDTTQLVLDLARQVCREAAGQAEEVKAGSGRSLASLRTAKAVCGLVAADFRLTVDGWGRDPWLLTTPSGTIDLHTGILREHRREDYMNKITAVAPGGDCPLWRAFLDRIMGSDQAMVDFLQRLCGYALTGSTQEQILPFLHGAGANGKSVFLSVLAHVWGDYAIGAPASTFTASVSEHSTELARLEGARLVLASEVEQGRKWATARIKTLTGGDGVTARYLHENFFTFQPVCKIFIAANCRPEAGAG